MSKMTNEELIQKLEIMIEDRMNHNDINRSQLFSNTKEYGDDIVPTLQTEHSRGFDSGMEVGYINANTSLRALLSMIKTYK